VFASSCVAAQAANIALNKPAFQVSQWPGNSVDAVASLAVDGNTASNFNDGSCTHTDYTQNAWWAVDLGAASAISSVTITNRGDGWAWRLANFKVGLTNTSPQVQAPVVGNYDVCASVSDELGLGETRNIPCFGTGRYLVIQLMSADPLTLCEVEVYAAANIALNKPAFQVSLWPGNSVNAVASLAVDGNTASNFNDGSCTHTDYAQNSWCAVDLGAFSVISSVTITNRGDGWSWRLANFKVGLTNTSPQVKAPAVGNYDVCASVSDELGLGETRNIPCFRRGRYLVIQLMSAEDPLTLCEVEVYAAA